MRASGWAVGALLLGLAGEARGEVLELSGRMERGAVVYILRPEARGVREVGRLRVTRLVGEWATAEVERGSADLREGDRLEVQASAPEEWLPFR